MPYLTTPITKNHQITLEDVLFGISQEQYDEKLKNTKDTRTIYRVTTPPRLLKDIDFDKMIDALRDFNRRRNYLIETQDKKTLYRSFKIPKRSGGLRQIDAPVDELMDALRDLKFILEKRMFSSYHTCAFAYIRGRCAVDAVKRHQRNKSKWFLKIDFHDFFGSTTNEFVLKMLSKIFPFNVIIARDKYVLENALSLCFLNGGLPQGTPISPTITNLMMIPIDHAIAKYCRNHSPSLCYTRYADDIIISSKTSFKWSEVQNDILKILSDFEAPFSLNTKKTRYGSASGRNWNLGVMLNKDNNITIGNGKKKIFKAMLFQFCTDYKNNEPWSIDDTAHLQGLRSYYEMVEGKNIENIVNKYSEKTGVDINAAIKNIISNKE